MKEKEKEILIITGESGAGKSSAMKHLEDLGFYCIDNIPPDLIPSLIRLIEDNPEIEKAALVIDIRNPGFRNAFPSILKKLKKQFAVQVWYFTAEKDILIKRFSETRRPHPFERYEPEKGLEELIEEEKEILKPMKQYAEIIIDTSKMTIHELKRFIKGLISGEKPRLKITFLSFGFKYGIPTSADNIFDVRFLPNPHFIPKLRPKTGMDKEVVDYIMKFDESKKILDLILKLVEFLIPMYEKEGKAYITFAIGCTGGQHRSIALAELLASQTYEKFPEYEIYVEHREKNVRRKIS
ncbi:RNase adapter RapZ [Desulfurobacterium thermolithotrophum]|uniref:RNase adapter RapZ n=1 Tax=Desulfurobacterium thermolithotrophum TaxID=64160 RepID=UPI0013D27247|nr:RNase adapter RapZ [Desulfurobacterium thermolithotrophum]